MRIAFTGAHGVGKTTAMNILLDTLKQEIEHIHIETLGSSTRGLMETGWDRDYQGFELACIYERRKWMMELQGKQVPWILSERCAIDETAYMYEKFHSNAGNANNYKLYDFYSVAHQEADWEAEVFWDCIFYIPVDDRPVPGDDVRPGSKEYQRLIDNNILKVIEKYYKLDVVRKMPTELDLWQGYFLEEVKKWKTKF